MKTGNGVAVGEILRYAMPSGGFPGSFALPVPFVWLKPIGVGWGPGVEFGSRRGEEAWWNFSFGRFGGKLLASKMV